MLAYRWSLVLPALLLAAPPPDSVPLQAAVPVKVTVTVAGRTQTQRGTGRCGHEPRASIYGAPAALWLAEFAGDEHMRVSLTYWRPSAPGSEPQFTLLVRERTADHRINTVEGGRLEGSGRATFRPTATGGRFEIAGTAQDRTSLQATIECARFGRIHAEGG
jgi:hypothetical protein